MTAPGLELMTYWIRGNDAIDYAKRTHEDSKIIQGLRRKEVDNGLNKGKKKGDHLKIIRENILHPSTFSLVPLSTSIQP